MSCFWCPNWLHISSFKIKQYHRHVCFQCPAKTSLCFARTFPLSWFAEVPIEEQPTLKVAWDLSGKCCKSRKLETTFEINGWDDLGRVIVIRYDFLQLIYFWLFLYNVVGAITCKRNCQAPAEDYIFCTSTLGVRKERTSQIFMTKSCWSVGVEPSSCEMNGPEWLTFVASCLRFFATFVKAPLTLQMSRSAVRARRPSPQLSQIRHSDSEVKKCFVAEGAKGTSCPRPFVETTPQRDDAFRAFG